MVSFNSNSVLDQVVDEYEARRENFYQTLVNTQSDADWIAIVSKMNHLCSVLDQYLKINEEELIYYRVTQKDWKIVIEKKNLITRIFVAIRGFFIYYWGNYCRDLKLRKVEDLAVFYGLHPQSQTTFSMIHLHSCVCYMKISNLFRKTIHPRTYHSCIQAQLQSSKLYRHFNDFTKMHLDFVYDPIFREVINSCEEDYRVKYEQAPPKQPPVKDFSKPYVQISANGGRYAVYPTKRYFELVRIN